MNISLRRKLISITKACGELFVSINYTANFVSRLIVRLNDNRLLFDKEELKRRVVDACHASHRGRSLMTNAMYETSSGLYLLGTRNRRHRVFKETNGSGDYVWCCTSAQRYPRCRLFALGLNKLAVTDSCARSWNVFLARCTCFFSVEITTRYFSFVSPYKGTLHEW